MQKTTLLLVITLLSITTSFAQKKDNGAIFIDHPAIKVVQDFMKALASGDESTIAGYLTEDFVSYNGTSKLPVGAGQKKASFVKNQIIMRDIFDYYSVTPFPGSYPDALEYKKDNAKGDVTVLSWDMIKGVHKVTGVEINSAMQRSFIVTKDNKIKVILNYVNEALIDEINASFSERTNGTIYKHHKNINTVRNIMYAWENNDYEKAFGSYSDKAVFTDINDEPGTTYTKAKTLEQRKMFRDNFELVAVEMSGYPDYLKYEENDGSDVLSWWVFHLVRKADKKKINLPVHLIDSFDKDGKIVAEINYYSDALLQKK